MAEHEHKYRLASSKTVVIPEGDKYVARAMTVTILWCECGEIKKRNWEDVTD